MRLRNPLGDGADLSPLLIPATRALTRRGRPKGISVCHAGNRAIVGDSCATTDMVAGGYPDRSGCDQAIETCCPLAPSPHAPGRGLNQMRGETWIAPACQRTPCKPPRHGRVGALVESGALARSTLQGALPTDIVAGNVGLRQVTDMSNPRLHQGAAKESLSGSDLAREPHRLHREGVGLGSSAPADAQHFDQIEQQETEAPEEDHKGKRQDQTRCPVLKHAAWGARLGRRSGRIGHRGRLQEGKCYG